MCLIFLHIRIRNLYCPYFTEKHQGTRKYINKDIWIPTHYKQTKTLSENTKQWYKIIEYNVERKWQWNDLYTLWHIPQAIAAIIHPEDTEPDEGATAVKRYNRIDIYIYIYIYSDLYGLSLNGWHALFRITYRPNRHDITITTHAIKRHFLIWMTTMRQPSKRRCSCNLTLKYTFLCLLVNETKYPQHLDCGRSIAATHWG